MKGMQTGVSYILTRDLSQARQDLAEIATCCNFVVHTFSETDFYYHRQNMREVIKLSRQQGLAVYLDPWGVGGVFGGETFSIFVAENPAACLKKKGKIIPIADISSQKFRKFMKEWLTAALAMEPDVIFWDEPHQTGMNYKREEIKKIIDFLAEMTLIVRQHRVKNAICVYPRKGKFAWQLWEKILSLKTIDIFGTDPYWLLWNKKLDFVEEFAKKVYNLGKKYDKEPQLWIQAFKIPPGKEQEISRAVEIAAKPGIGNIAAWSYDCGSLVGHLNSADPRLVWQTLKQAFKTVKDSDRVIEW
ncbi:MAG: hypothetical protein HY920_07490 [Elusimicrobia bacterium]|nr:hypothetical protein [Elusimicrobiota bacterium]